MGLPDSSPSTDRAGWGSLRELDRYQWFVFAVAALAWMADCMDQQLFNLARRGAISELVNNDPKRVADWAGYSTSVFLVGWAIGGIIFGMLGDRLGRVKTLTTTVLLYSIFTGLSAASVTVWDFCGYRFLTGLGVGGVFSAAVALLAETMPSRARPFTLALMQALSAIGNCTAAGLYVLLGSLEQSGSLGNVTAWRMMFLIGLVPAILVIFIQRKLKEPEAWRLAREAQLRGEGKALGSFSEMFGHPTWRRHALLGLLLAFSGVVGLWGIGFFSVDLQQYVFRGTFKAEAEAMGLDAEATKRYMTGQGIIWAGITSLMLNIGAFLGMLSFGYITSKIGRRPTFAIGFTLAALSTALVFWKLEKRDDILWMIPLMGFCQLALFGGYAIYFPELFPTRLRSTGTSFCYNVGRLVAAVGPALLGLLTTRVFSVENGYQEPEPFRYAGITMCSVFLLGLIALPFLPETKGKPLPE
jgi:MFS family permease